MRAIYLCACLCLTAMPVLAGEYHVAPAGLDENDGSELAPWRTIGHAASMVGPGDTVWIHEGVYHERVILDASGTSSERIGFYAAEGESPVIDGEGVDVSEWSWFVAIRGDYLDFAGFEVRNSSGVCLGVGGNHVTVRENEVHHCYNHGVQVAAEGVVIDGNSIYEASRKNVDRTGGWDGGLGTYNARDTQFINNVVFHNHGEGVGSLLSHNTLIRGNVVYDNFSVNIYSDNAKDVRIEANLVYCTPDSGFERDGHPASGILSATEDRGEETIESERITVVNNIVAGCNVGFGFAHWPGVTIENNEMRDTLVANNTFVNALYSAISIGGTLHPGSSVVNNIVYQGNDRPTFTGDVSDLALGRNCWYGQSPGEAGAAGDILDDPALSDPGGIEADDYRIGAESPCRDAAAVMAEVTEDFFGTSRPQPPGGGADIGAHEYTDPIEPDEAIAEGEDIVPEPAEEVPEEIHDTEDRDTGIQDAAADPGPATQGPEGCSCRVVL